MPVTPGTGDGLQTWKIESQQTVSTGGYPHIL